jgi:hypothetical protein
MSISKPKLSVQFVKGKKNQDKQAEKQPLKRKEVSQSSSEDSQNTTQSWICPLRFFSSWSTRPQTELDVGEMNLTASEIKAQQKLEIMATQFKLSKERCQCRIEAVNAQIKSIPRIDINRERIIILLKRRQQLMKQLSKIESAAASIENYKYMVQDASINKDIMLSVVELRKIIKSATKSTLGSSADKAAKRANSAVEGLEEIRDDMNEISDSVSSLGLGADINLYDDFDEQFKSEIDSWAKEGFYLFDNNDDKIPSVSDLPSLPKIPEIVEEKIPSNKTNKAERISI